MIRSSALSRNGTAALNHDTMKRYNVVKLETWLSAVSLIRTVTSTL